MVKVDGIGGIFFRVSDTEKITAWYQEHLGIGGPNELWEQQAGPTVFAPFRKDSDYFAADKSFMLNFRVSDLDALITSLKAKGVAVETRDEWDHTEYGSFARIHDPDGTPIELWEPPSADIA
jgi:catechol 2,3-dioxygenase-like lactoylglutathione lyase family enzyme